MLNKVVEEGTGKRAMLDGIRAAGKTGTTNGYRDAWFVGYTGNLVAGVWFGNDDHTSTNNMTGGTLPAMTWKEVMAFAHQNLELRPIPGLAPEHGTGRRLRLELVAAIGKNRAAGRHSADRRRAPCRGAPSRRSRTSAHSSARPTQPASSPRRRPTAAPRRDKPGSNPPSQRYGFGPTPAARSGKQGEVVSLAPRSSPPPSGEELEVGVQAPSALSSTEALSPPP